MIIIKAISWLGFLGACVSIALFFITKDNIKKAAAAAAAICIVLGLVFTGLSHMLQPDVKEQQTAKSEQSQPDQQEKHAKSRKNNKPHDNAEDRAYTKNWLDAENSFYRTSQAMIEAGELPGIDSVHVTRMTQPDKRLDFVVVTKGSPNEEQVQNGVNLSLYGYSYAISAFIDTYSQPEGTDNGVNYGSLYDEYDVTITVQSADPSQSVPGHWKNGRMFIEKGTFSAEMP